MLSKLSKIEKFRDEHPKVRRILDEISDFCDKALIVNYIITFIISTFVICVPTIMAFLCLSDKDRGWIASIVGGVLSLTKAGCSPTEWRKSAKKE